MCCTVSVAGLCGICDPHADSFLLTAMLSESGLCLTPGLLVGTASATVPQPPSMFRSSQSAVPCSCCIGMWPRDERSHRVSRTRSGIPGRQRWGLMCWASGRKAMTGQTSTACAGIPPARLWRLRMTLVACACLRTPASRRRVCANATWDTPRMSCRYALLPGLAKF